jgi:ketosteroid isomerase-like protein
MSEEIIELYERVGQAINRREVSPELVAPGFRLENISTAVTGKTYHGPQGAREWISEFFEAFDEDSRFEIEEVLADGDDFVVARVRLVGHGARSGAPLDLRHIAVTWFQGGKVTRWAGFAHRREALEAVGLEG